MATPDHPFYAPEIDIPRFLFRGFNKHSGGGFRGLNTTEGIVPLAFLKKLDKDMEIDSQMNPALIKARVKFHCCQEAFSPTPFSSWSHDWRTALSFASHRPSPRNAREWCILEEGGAGHIAVLDTWAFGDEWKLRNRIFHVPQFNINIPRLYIPCEWLIWGPVYGPAYRCVPTSAIQAAINCWKWPRHIPSKQTERFLLHADIRKSMLVAQCFQRKEDTSADVVLTVAAAELATRYYGKEHMAAPEGDPEMIFETEPLWPRHVLNKILDLITLCNPVLSGRPLVHGNTALEGFPRTSLMYDLLLGVEARWRGNNSGTKCVPLRWGVILKETGDWHESQCQRCLKEGIPRATRSTTLSQSQYSHKYTLRPRGKTS